MSDRLDRAREAASQLDPGWTAVEVEAALRRLPARRRRRRILRVGGGVALAVGAAAAVLAIRAGDRQGPRPATELLRLADGSTATALTDSAQVLPLEIGPERVVLRLVRGAAQFAVTPSPERSFRVHAGAVEVMAIGTEFAVDRRAAGVDVVVHAGRVRVEAGGTAVELIGGQRRRFIDAAPPAEPSASADPPAPAQPPRPASAPMRAGPPSPREAPGPARAARSWRALAAGGEFDDAYRQLDLADVPDNVDDLLLAADICRLSGHPRNAVAPLRRVVEAHRSDPRRQIAAFTLGRVHLDELGDPRAAAEAFASARAAAPGGPLAEDALAREVEAWSRAGEEGRAAAAAERYIELYPVGRRLKAVRRFGGID